MNKKLIVLTLLICLGISGVSQTRDLSDYGKRVIVEKALSLIRENYVFPERVEEIEKKLNKNLDSGIYSAENNGEEFIKKLNKDIESYANDKHLKISSSPTVVDRIRKDEGGNVEVSQQYIDLLQRQNFRLRKVESNESNIGYFKFDNFVELQYSRESFTGAMNFLFYSSAIIIDLTENGGGNSDALDFFLSFFLPDSTKISELWFRKTGERTETYCKHYPEVKKMLNTPLYILVSNRTASAAEGAAYTLQQLGRATIIGEQTRGVANPGELREINDSLYIMIPSILNKNAITGTNWDNTGVTPDIRVESKYAFPRAMMAALQYLGEKASSKEEAFYDYWMAKPYEAILSPEIPAPGFLEKCAGKYEDGREIIMKDGFLYFSVKSSGLFVKLAYMSNNTFTAEGKKEWRLRFAVNSNNIVDRCEILWYDNTKDQYKRVE